MNVDVAGPAGRLEALIEEPDGARFAAVVCHPHPTLGGTMHTHAAYRIAKAVVARGGASLRFNFRGVGRSAGRFDAGRGEADDTRAALAWLARERPHVPLLCAGFSFGAWIALLAAGSDPAVRGLLLAGVAVRAEGLALEDFRETGRASSGAPSIERGFAASAGLVRDVEKPVAVVQAEGDPLGPPAEIEEAVRGSRGPRRLSVVKGATHLFTEDLPALQREAEAALAWLLGEQR
jgi:alpha/beta superfamily hydrolase